MTPVHARGQRRVRPFRESAAATHVSADDVNRERSIEVRW